MRVSITGRSSQQGHVPAAVVQQRRCSMEAARVGFEVRSQRWAQQLAASATQQLPTAA